MEKIKLLLPTENMPVTPVGQLKENGWTAGTYVYFVDESVDPSFKVKVGTLAAVDVWSSKEGAEGTKPNRPAGFMIHGSQTTSSNLEPEITYQYVPFEPRDIVTFDKKNQLEKQGTSIATMVVATTGMVKTYVFERKDSSNADITYKAGDVMYVSENYLWTNEIFEDSGTKGWHSGYQLANKSVDENGEFLVLINTW